MKIDLSKVYIDNDIRESVMQVFDSGWFTLGEKLIEFEEKFAKFIGTKFAIGVSSGTAAIQLSLESIGIKDGDEVIVPSHTAFPTIEPIIHCRGRPVFAEIDLKNYTLDSESVKDHISQKTKAIIPVHIYGHPAQMDILLELAEKHSISIIEDCCQSSGAKFLGKKVGSFGKIGCFSFYPSKNMTVCGDGGMITTDDEHLYEKIKMLRNHGMIEKYHHILVGHNFRLNEIASAIGIIQLNKLSEFNEVRRKKAHQYSQLLEGCGVKLPNETSWAYHVFHLYVIRLKKREKMIKYLKSSGITTGIHYPIPCHLQPALSNYPLAKMPITEKVAQEVLSLPMFPQLSEEEIDFVAKTIKTSIKEIGDISP